MAELRPYGLQKIKGSHSTQTSLTKRNNRAVALKIAAANTGSIELDNLLKLKKIDPQNPCHRHLPELLDHFEHSQGEYTHTCLVFEMLGENLRTFCRRFFPLNKLPSGLDKVVARQLISILEFLHDVCHFVHTGTRDVVDRLIR